MSSNANGNGNGNGNENENGSNSPTGWTGSTGTNSSNPDANVLPNTDNQGAVNQWSYTQGNVVINSNVFIPNSDTIANIILNQTITGPGYVVTNQQGIAENGNVLTNTDFITTSNLTVDVLGDFDGVVSTGYDDSSVTGNLVAQIRTYAQDILCEDFHNKGSIDDYSALFTAAAKIANESKQMKLDIDIDGFDDFAQAADDLSALFVSFTQKLQTVNIIDDTDFLTAVLNALRKIANLSNVFGKFKDTILLTSTIRIPQSAHTTSLILSNVMAEVSCAMNYINHFVNPVNIMPQANLSVQDKGIITKAVETIDSWNVLCEQGVTIALSHDTDIQYINQANADLKTKTNLLKNATSTLKAKLLALTT